MRIASAVMLLIQGSLTLLISAFLCFMAIVGPAIQLAEDNFGEDDLFAGIFYGVIAAVGMVLAIV